MSKAVHLALDVLELLGEGGVPLRLTEIAARLDHPKATVHRAVAALEQRGYVLQLPDERYRLGLRCLTLGGFAADGLDLRSVARPHLEALNQATRENVHLAVYEGGDVVYLDVVQSPLPVAPKSKVGSWAPATAVATGRALLAHQSMTEIDRVLSAPLETYTARSITDPDELRALLDEVREQGVARNHSSYREGVCGIAAPVHDHTGLVVASVGCCLPEERLDDARDPELEAEVRRAAAAVSQELGYRIPAVGGVA